MNIFEGILVGFILVAQIGAFMFCVELYINRMLRQRDGTNGDGSLRV